MPGWFKRVIASRADYLRGGMTGTARQRFADSDQGGTGDNLYDSSFDIGGLTNLGNTVVTANDGVIYLTPFSIPMYSVFTGAIVLINSLVANAKARVGLYRDTLQGQFSAINGLPIFELVYAFPEIATTALMQCQSSFEIAEVDQGAYYIASTFSAIQAVFAFRADLPNQGNAFFGYRQGVQTLNPIIRRIGLFAPNGLGAYGPLPTIINPQVSDDARVPRVLLRYQCTGPLV